jgi:branched-chain amino acid transport system substrate-binding protein
MKALARRTLATGIVYVLALYVGVLVGSWPLNAGAQTIKIGSTAPFSGPASAYALFANAQAAYYNMINEQGGISGRKIEFVMLDDAFSPPKTVEQTRKLVESDDILATVGSVGTATQLAVQKYLNSSKVPQLLVGSGAGRLHDPEHFPWTFGYAPSYELEGKIYARYILSAKPGAKIGVFTQNDDGGRDYVKGFKSGLGNNIGQISSETNYQATDPTIDSQIVTMKQSGADAVFIVAAPKFAAMAIRKIGSLGWRPLIVLASVSNSVSTVMEPAGVENSTGAITGLFLKDPTDKLWAGDPTVSEYLTWVRKYAPNANSADLLNVHGYTIAQIMVQILKNCGSEISRENILKQAKSLKDVSLPMLLPGIKVSVDSSSTSAISQLQLARFEDGGWVRFGDIFGKDY